MRCGLRPICVASTIQSPGVAKSTTYLCRKRLPHSLAKGNFPRPLQRQCYAMLMFLSIHGPILGTLAEQSHKASHLSSHPVQISTNGAPSPSLALIGNCGCVGPWL